MKKHTHSLIYRDESRLFVAALATFAIVFVAYAYFVSVSVADVVMRKEADAQITELSTRIGQLEAEYIEQQHSLNAETATQAGFVHVASKVFIDTTGDTLVLRSN